MTERGTLSSNKTIAWRMNIYLDKPEMLGYLDINRLKYLRSFGMIHTDISCISYFNSSDVDLCACQLFGFSTGWSSNQHV